MFSGSPLRSAVLSKVLQNKNIVAYIKMRHSPGFSLMLIISQQGLRAAVRKPMTCKCRSQCAIGFLLSRRSGSHLFAHWSPVVRIKSSWLSRSHLKNGHVPYWIPLPTFVILPGKAILHGDIVLKLPIEMTTFKIHGEKLTIHRILRAYSWFISV